MKTDWLKFRACLFVAGLLAVLNFMFGLEPQLSLRATTNTSVVKGSFDQYMASSLKTNGTNIFTKTLTAIVYPGAWIGGAIHNQFVALN